MDIDWKIVGLTFVLTLAAAAAAYIYVLGVW